MTAIRLDALTRTFGTVRAVDDISLTIEDGEFFTLLGPSGCGKTTLLRMIAGFSDVERGSIWFDDRRIDQLPAHQRNIGMVFQNYAIFPNLTVAQNVAYGLHARKIARGEVDRRVAEALAMVELPDHGTRWPHEMSGGQLQRVAIARSLVIKPAVLLFDEPLSNLDAQLRTHMRVEIRQLQKSLGLTAVYVTHDQEEALAISDRIAVLRGGRIEQVGTPEAIYRTPGTAFVGSFMGATNMLAGMVEASDDDTTRITAGGATVLVRGRQGAAGDRVLLSIRPETLRLAADGHDGPQLVVRLTLREFLGPILRLHATLPDGTALRVAALGGQEVRATPGAEMALGYDPAQIIVYPAP
ncbi:MAG TPA: ABC transporter ATP-binding protein [Aliidongia sp.]|uniref:ABC transporter ATP-binding protein n=1 Tax=Aliidongia sp. TaxID=1914230 RepID=UPI002DDCB759|nr:ABC transporter ATP-binding protein [Aliidongia sp.]HEV2674781.1 ABC transporter ATP-binding protein [Aliidongia sp.]